MAQDPFHLISTPIAVLPGLGLRAQAGLSGEDPGASRYQGLGFAVWLTVYDPAGKRIERRRLEDLRAGERRSLDLTALTEAHGFREPYLCVLHRVPEPMPEGHLDFDMYRTVVQYARPGGGRGSVIYETPPRFNAKPGGAFLSFTNQVVVGAGMNTRLLVLHYSVAESYSAEAPVRVLAFAPDGRRVLKHDARVAAFTVKAFDMGELCPDGGARVQRSVVVCSPSASMVPLLLNLHEGTGGVSVEHTHPPLAYLGMPVPEALRVRAEAIRHYMEAA